MSAAIRDSADVVRRPGENSRFAMWRTVGNEESETATMAYFDQMSLSRRAWESAGGAVVAGALTGILLGVNLWAYIVATLVSVVGAVPAGSQHRTVGGALLRGFVGATAWSTALLIAHGITGLPATSALPEPPVAFLPLCFLPTALVAAIVWLVANRRRASMGNDPGGALGSRTHGGTVGSRPRADNAIDDHPT